MRYPYFFRLPAGCRLLAGRLAAKCRLLPLALALFLSARVAAQAPAPHLDTALVRYFSGKWTGEGTFAGGKPISADVAFHLSLDSSWLVCEHRDRAPNEYRATLYWGVDGQTGMFVAYAFDNSHGHRQFVSNGWIRGRLILTAQGTSQNNVIFEHFIYEFVSDKQLKVTYELSGDGGIHWQLGDSLVFHRVAG